MTDYALCSNNDCPIRHDCFRYTAPPAKDNQSYAEFIHTKDGCPDFIPNPDEAA